MGQPIAQRVSHSSTPQKPLHFAARLGGETIRLCLIKIAGRVTEMITRIKIALPTAYPYQASFTDLTGRIASLPP